MATETKVTHTPGPWTVEPGDGGDASVGLGATPPTIFVNVPNDDRYRDVAIATILEPIYGDDEDGNPLYWGDADANACLIAAAPDLLAALKVAAAAINPSDIGGISLMTWNERLRAATVVINAAIQKAEGA